MVFVTGSSSKLMALEVETALRGRNWSVPGFLFFFREYLQVHQLDPDDTEVSFGRRKAETKQHFAEYAQWGGSAGDDGPESYGQGEVIEGVSTGDVLPGSRRAIRHDEHRALRRPLR